MKNSAFRCTHNLLVIICIIRPTRLFISSDLLIILWRIYLSIYPKEEKIHHIIFGKNNEDNSNWQQAGNNPRTITLLLTRKELPLRIKQKYMPNTFNLKKKKFHMTWEHYYCVKIFIYTLKLLHSDTCNITIFSIQTHGSMAEKLSFSRLYSNTSSWTSDDQMF